jgi:hypothetical protein
MKKGRIHSSFFKRNNITPEEAYLIVNNMVILKIYRCYLGRKI